MIKERGFKTEEEKGFDMGNYEFARTPDEAMEKFINREFPDVLEINKLALEQSKASRDYQGKMSEIQSRTRMDLEKLKVEREKLQVDRDNQKNDLAIAKENAKGRANAKPKTK